MTIQIDGESGNNELITVIDDNGIEYPWHRRKGTNESEENLLLLIRNREYPDCPTEKKGDLETMEEWIKDGCPIEESEGIFFEAEKVPWKSTHPEPDKHKILEQQIIDLTKRIKALENP